MTMPASLTLCPNLTHRRHLPCYNMCCWLPYITPCSRSQESGLGLTCSAISDLACRYLALSIRCACFCRLSAACLSLAARACRGTRSTTAQRGKEQRGNVEFLWPLVQQGILSDLWLVPFFIAET